MKLHKQGWANLDQRKSIFLRKKCFQTCLTQKSDHDTAMSLKFLYQVVFYGHEIGQSAKKLTNLWCTITFAFSQVASRQKNSANSQNTNLAIILWHCNFTIFHMSWANFSFFKCFINCIEYHILVNSTICS